jgi:uncharacterized protein (TIGR02757 family)
MESDNRSYKFIESTRVINKVFIAYKSFCRIKKDLFSHKRISLMTKHLKASLDAIYAAYHNPSYLYLDPLQYVHRFRGKLNIEIAGLLCSALSYGRVEQIRKNLEKVLCITGDDISGFSASVPLHEKIRLFSSIKHRFNAGTDIAVLLESCACAVRRNGSLEALFLKGPEDTIRDALDKFVLSLRAIAGTILKGRASTMYFFLPRPSSGSTCKRLNMFLRWMVRENDGIDLGVWPGVPASKLVMPVDTHIAALSARMGITKRKTVDWNMAEEITAAMRRIYPDDPVRCDFSLCRAGMIDFRKIRKAA